jgi:hypothetical protein
VGAGRGAHAGQRRLGLHGRVADERLGLSHLVLRETVTVAHLLAATLVVAGIVVLARAS